MIKDFFGEGHFEQASLQTERMALEPIGVGHGQEFFELLSDPELHRFLPSDPLTLEQQTARCAFWEKRKSPDGKELWLNWVGRDRSSKSLVAHFQVGVKEDGIASIGYVVARGSQKKGFAFEGLQAVFNYLRDHLKVSEVKAWSDTRNVASHHLAKKLGMSEVEFIKDADAFKGSPSDEFVFSKVFHD